MGTSTGIGMNAPFASEGSAIDDDEDDDPEEYIIELEEAFERATQKIKRYERDFQQYRSRMEKELGGQRTVVEQEMYNRLFPILDHFDRILRTNTIDRSNPNEDTPPICNFVIKAKERTIRDIELIYHDLLDRLSIDVLISFPGAVYDESVHKIVKMIGKNPDTSALVVLESIRPGYQFGTTILRPEEIVLGMRSTQSVSKSKHGNSVQETVNKVSDRQSFWQRMKDRFQRKRKKSGTNRAFHYPPGCLYQRFEE